MTARDNVQRHRTFLPCAAALLALGTLGACTSSGAAGSPGASSPASTSAASTSKAPSSTATTSAAPTPTTSTDPVVAKIPPAARANSEAGGVTFAKFYFAQLNEAFRTGDASTIDALATPDCVTCQAFSDGVRKLHTQGRHYGSDLVAVKDASALNFTDEKRQVLLEIEQSTVKVLDSSGKTVDTTPGGKASFVSSLKFDGSRWAVSRLQKVKS